MPSMQSSKIFSPLVFAEAQKGLRKTHKGISGIYWLQNEPGKIPKIYVFLYSIDFNGQCYR